MFIWLEWHGMNKLSGADLVIVLPLILIAAPSSQRSGIPQHDWVLRCKGDGWMKGGARDGEESKKQAREIKEKRLDSCSWRGPNKSGIPFWARGKGVQELSVVFTFRYDLFTIPHCYHRRSWLSYHNWSPLTDSSTAMQTQTHMIGSKIYMFKHLAL